MGSDWDGNGVELRGTGLDWWGTGSDWWVGLVGQTGGSDWGIRGGPTHLAPLFASDAPRPPAST